MSKVPSAQDQEPQLKLLRARQQTYLLIERLLIAQILLTVPLPVFGALASNVFPAFKAPIAAVALLITVIDPVLVDRAQRQLLKRRALIAEEFDCSVLDLPWDRFTAGAMVRPEDIHAAAKQYAARYGDERLLGWYSTKAAEVPGHLARIICQRSNLRYGSKLRGYYRGVLLLGALFSVIGLALAGFFAAGLAANTTVKDWVLTLTPLTPLVSWALREYYSQSDAATQIENLTGESESLWQDALSGRCDPSCCATRSRQLQSAIFLRRSSDPPILPGIYRLNRSKLDDQMNEGAAALVREYQQSATSDSDNLDPSGEL